MGGGDKQATSSCKITGIHKSSSAPGRFLQLMSTDVSEGFNDTNEIGGDFHKSPMNYMVHQAWTSCATLAHPFSFTKINIVASENRHVGCNSLSVCLLIVPNIFIKKQFPR